ncbi:MAG TPA: hypothetical protein VKG44_10555, partial [Candidatus Baltobacteraceae bacterium]|nr:hypothetical protein [Candidatus Baltobacteraceae bacterium]
GRMDDEVVPFLMHLTFAFAKKPVFFTEFGNPTCPPGVAPEDSPFASACLTEREMVHYGRSVLDHLQARGASGAMWWCWADYDAALRTQPPFDRAPHELHFGIIRDDGSEKPVARMLAEFAALQRETVALQAPAFSPEEAAYYAGLPATLTGSFRTYCARMEAA